MRTTRHRARAAIALLASALALGVFIGPVTAATPQQVTIVSNVTFNPDGPNYGSFVASGPAVESGLICENGTFVDTGIRFAGYQSDRGIVQLQVDKAFTCADGGTFSVKLQIQANFDTGIESFSWVAKGGTGSYGALRGSGSGSTVPSPPTGNVNTYEGFLVR